MTAGCTAAARSTKKNSCAGWLLSLALALACLTTSCRALPQLAVPSAQQLQQQQHALLQQQPQGPAAAAAQQQHKSYYYQPQLLHYGTSVAPVLSNYSFASALDTFDICRQQAGLPEGQDVPQEELLQLFRLPKDLNKHKHLTLQQLVELLHGVQPAVRVVFGPMLSGEVDISRLLDPPAPHGSPHNQLPKLVHFTVKDKNRLQPHQVLAMASWAYYNPGYSLMLFDDADIHAFMHTYYPHLLATFDGLRSPVERTDMWRYLVLCRLGGVYADSDVMAARPISQWAQDAGLLVGIENVFTTPEEARQRSYSRQVQMVQWSIAARPGHPVVCRMGQYVAQHVAEERAGEFLDPDRDHAILERTGPGIWSDSVHDYLKQVANVSVEQLVAGGRVGDVRILPQPVFGCPTAVFHAADPLPYVYHMFMGSWKMAQPSGLSTFIRKLSSTLHHNKQQQLKEGSDAEAGGAGGPAAAAAGSSEAGGAAVHLSKHPRRPILEEQIAQHQSQLLLQQQQQKQPATGLSLQAPAAAVAASTQHSTVGAGSAVQQQQQVAAAADGAGVDAAAKPTAAAAPVLHTSSSRPISTQRKLRSSQVLLVRAPVPTTNMVQHGLLMEPEVPSTSSLALSGMPTLSLLVVVALLGATLFKGQKGRALWASAGRFAGGLQQQQPIGPRSSGGHLSRPHSRSHLAAAGGGGGAGVSSSSSGSMGLLLGGSNPLLLVPSQPGLLCGSGGGAAAGSATAAAAAAAAAAAGGSRGVLQEAAAVSCSSSQHAARGGHGHKRSWGSSASFQQL